MPRLGDDPNVPSPDPSKTEWCTCSKLCKGGSWVQPRTYQRHKFQSHGLEIGAVLLNVVQDTQYSLKQARLILKSYPPDFEFEQEEQQCHPEYPVQPEEDSSGSQEAPAMPTCSDHDLRPSTPMGEGESFSCPPSRAASPCFPDGDEEETRTDEGTEEDEFGDREQDENSGDDAEPYEDEMEDIRYTARPVSGDSEFPRASLPNLQFSQDIIDEIRNATLEDDLDADLAAQVRNPTNEIEEVDPISRLSMDIFGSLLNSSQQAYVDIKESLRQFDPDIVLDSHFVTKRKLERITGVFKLSRVHRTFC
ncbi:hypothetical protein F5887DRAFT_1193303 [Amanita rubescens]|nr:hypothetical protein F5887DRAFT_1193303 [Amanita rubescens]